MPRTVDLYFEAQKTQLTPIGFIFLLLIMGVHHLLSSLELISFDQEVKIIQLETLLAILDLLAAVVGPGNGLGKPIDINGAADHIFGLVLINDWSGIFRHGNMCIGPFLGKSFGTTISPWIITLDALEPFAIDAPEQNPRPLPYLTEKKSKNYDISLQVSVTPAGHEETSIVTRSNFKNLYWTITQQLINGCNVRPGDIFGTGTISGPEPESY